MTINLTSSGLQPGHFFKSLDPTIPSDTGSLGSAYPPPDGIVVGDIINYNDQAKDKPFNINHLFKGAHKGPKPKLPVQFAEFARLHPTLSKDLANKVENPTGGQFDGPGRLTPGQLTGKLDPPGKDGGHAGADGIDLSSDAANGMDLVDGGDVAGCKSDADCGYHASCVQVLPGTPKRCWCVHELVSPDPVTGACSPRSTEKPYPHNNESVLLHDQIKSIISHDNLTSPRGNNETTSMLRLPTDSSSTATPLPAIIAPVIGSFVLVALIICLSFVYRRRYLKKQLCAKRNGDNIVRNNDGAMLLDRMNNIIKNPTYFYPNGAAFMRHNVREVAHDDLRLLEVVGEGAFGQVFKGKMYSPEIEGYKQVAVKILKDGASHEAQEDFEREVEIMAAFDHDNILRLVGIVTQGAEGSPYMIFEYMEHGDLSELLRKNDPHLRAASDKVIILNKTDLVDVSVQIANGMSYLAAQRFVHRDLATRNCLVGGDLTVKISDFGMSRDIYTNDYYKIGGSRMLPVRWMSPEAIKYGRFTCESDIWAYGVVLWEIFSYGKQPYYGHTNEEVIHFLDQGILLQRPEECPSTVYHVMLGCWKKDPRQRIVFERLVKYLTDYRNRLSRPPQQQQQQQQQQLLLQGTDTSASSPEASSPSDIVQFHDAVKSGEGSDSGLNEKQGLENRTPSDVNSINIVDLNVPTCLATLASESELSRSPLSKQPRYHSSSLREAGSPRSNRRTNTGVRDLLGTTQTDSKSKSRDKLRTEDAVLTHQQRSTTSRKPKKSTPKRTASYPLCVPRASAGENGDVGKGGCEKTAHSPASLKYVVATFEKKKSDPIPAGGLESCLSVAPCSHNTAGSVLGNPNLSKTSTSHHKTNKVNDRSGFPDLSKKGKNQSMGISDSLLSVARADDGMDARTTRSQSPLNEYSIPGKVLP